MCVYKKSEQGGGSLPECIKCLQNPITSGAGCATVTDHEDVLGLEPNALTILLHCFICADSSATLSEPAIPAATVTSAQLPCILL